VERTAAGIVEGHAIKMAGTKDVVALHLDDFSDALPATVELEAAGLRQISRDCRGAKRQGGSEPDGCRQQCKFVLVHSAILPLLAAS
jgi:hypothetical protein